MTTRLSTIAVDLVHTLEDQPPAVLRRIAVEAAMLAVTRTRLLDSRLVAPLAAMRGNQEVAPTARIQVAQLVEDLDERAWDLQDLLDSGAGSEEAYLEAFRKARAAAAVRYALDADPMTAAFESVYEAQAAVVDLGAVRMAVAVAIASDR